MDIPNTPSAVTRANRRTLLLTALVFILPVIIAYTLLKTGWYTAAGTSNRGLLINPPIPFDEFQFSSIDAHPVPANQFRNKWWILYVMPQQCDAACRNSLYLMRQTHQALGQDQPRVAELIVMPHALDPELAQWLDQEFPGAQRVTADTRNVDAVLRDAMTNNVMASQAGHLFLVDTMGAIFMHYPAYADEQESILKGRDLLKDLQKMLKISKIG